MGHRQGSVPVHGPAGSTAPSGARRCRGEIEAAHGLLRLVMVTSAENRGSRGDVGISDLRAAGLPAPSIVGPAKIATVDARDAQRLGTLSGADRKAVAAGLRAILGAMFERK